MSTSHGSSAEALAQLGRRQEVLGQPQLQLGERTMAGGGLARQVQRLEERPRAPAGASSRAWTQRGDARLLRGLLEVDPRERPRAMRGSDETDRLTEQCLW